MNVLVTGGAGFIGSHLVDALLERGHAVRILDSLEPQVHHATGGTSDQCRPFYLTREADLWIGDLRDRDLVRRALDGVEVVFHEAAAVGVGQSMYDIRRYMDVNTVGTATLLDVIVNDRIPLRKLVVASSMSIYGEGRYVCSRCGPAYPQERRWLLDHTRMENGDSESVPIFNFQFPISNKWEQRCPYCQDPVAPVPTDEDKPLQPNSPYAIGKKDTEELALSIGRAYGIPTVALRYFNVYGSRQALSNPYTGAAAIFATRLLNGNPPIIYEDGLQRRDFVHVSDIVQANLLALERDGADYQAVNIGTGRALSILDLAQLLSDHLTAGAVPLQVTGQFRAGDIRHCYADITRAREYLGYEPQVRFEDGIAELVEWVREQTVTDPFEKAAQELQQRGLTR